MKRRYKSEKDAEVIVKRLAAWQALTPQQQIEALDKRLGVGVGATKQRARITKPVVVEVVVAPAVEVKEKGDSNGRKKRKYRAYR